MRVEGADWSPWASYGLAVLPGPSPDPRRSSPIQSPWLSDSTARAWASLVLLCPQPEDQGPLV